MVHTPVTRSLAAPIVNGTVQDDGAIAHYLNAALHLDPPLRVRGYPPQVQIDLPGVHVSYIGHLLPQLESALQNLPGPKFWEVTLFIVETGEPTSRLVYHRLLEKPVSHLDNKSSVNPALTAFQSVASTAVADSHRLGDAVVATTPPLRWRRYRDRKQTTARHWWQSGLLAAIAGVSFVFGTWLTSDSASEERSRFSVLNRQTNVVHLPGRRDRGPKLQLNPILSPQATQDLPTALNQLTNATAPPTTLPPWPSAAVIEPVTNSDAAATTTLTAPPSASTVAVSLKAVGDIIPGTDFPTYRLPQDPNYLFNSVKMFLGEVDILFGNFESTFTDYPYSAKDVSQGMTFAFRTPPAFADVLKSAGFDVLSVANNHSFDFGTTGFNDTIAHIEQSGMQAVGRKEDIVTVEANGSTVAFVGFSYWPDHNNMNDLATASALVETAEELADIVVISVHAGAEGTDALRVRDRIEYFLSENRGNMVQFSRTMINAGADLILGHGPHVPRAIELYQNRLIAYSLGNFLGYQTLSTIGPLGQSMILQVELGPAGEFVKGRVIPVALDENGVPYIDDGFASVILVRQLTAQDFPETPLTINSMGYILRTE